MRTWTLIRDQCVNSNNDAWLIPSTPMKTIEIRFLLEGGMYHIQRKTWLGRWIYIGYNSGSIGGDVFYLRTNKNAELLLQEVIEHYYNLPKSKVRVIEHPTLVIY